MAENGNPFSNHPTLGQIAVAFTGLAAIATGVKIFDQLHSTVFFLLAIAALLGAFATAHQPISPNSKTYQLKSSLSAWSWLIAAIFLSIYGVRTLATEKTTAADERAAASAAIAIKVDDAIFRPYFKLDYPPELASYNVISAGSYSFPWSLMQKYKLNPWIELPSDFPESELTEYSEFENDNAKKEYLSRTSRLAKMFFYPMMTPIPLNDIGALAAGGTSPEPESFLVGLSINDSRKGECYIESVKVTVHRFYTLPPPSAAKAGMPLDIDIALVPISKLKTPLPWNFSATHFLNTGIDKFPRPWLNRRPRFSNHEVGLLMVKLLPADRGIYVYSASMVVKDSFGQSMPITLIPPENPRAFAALFSQKGEIQDDDAKVFYNKSFEMLPSLDEGRFQNGTSPDAFDPSLMRNIEPFDVGLPPPAPPGP